MTNFGRSVIKTFFGIFSASRKYFRNVTLSIALGELHFYLSRTDDYAKDGGPEVVLPRSFAVVTFVFGKLQS